MKAAFQTPLPDNAVLCGLCRHRCRIETGQRGLCGVRENRQGTLFTLVYGRLIARNVDPIEKKPLFHYHPRSRSYSIATVGCNFRCRFCQNADIAQMPHDRNGMIMGDEVSPEAVVNDAASSGCKSISYTYTEPTVFLEYAFDIMKKAREKGLKNIWVSNGFFSEETLNLILPYLDAINIDLKGFTEEFYKKYCGARLEPVLRNLKELYKNKVHLEVTTLVIPSLNDQPAQFEQIARFIKQYFGYLCIENRYYPLSC